MSNKKAPQAAEAAQGTNTQLQDTTEPAKSQINQPNRADEWLVFVGYITDQKVNSGAPVPLYDSKPRTDGKPSINTMEGWNRLCEEHWARQTPEEREKIMKFLEQQKKIRGAIKCE